MTDGLGVQCRVAAEYHDRAPSVPEEMGAGLDPLPGAPWRSAGGTLFGQLLELVCRQHRIYTTSRESTASACQELGLFTGEVVGGSGVCSHRVGGNRECGRQRGFGETKAGEDRGNELLEVDLSERADWHEFFTTGSVTGGVS